jgi:hypothetical protein
VTNGYTNGDAAVAAHAGPAPLDVTGLGDTTAALAEHFGPGEVAIGVTTTSDPHAGLHRADLCAPGNPLLPACGHTSHGTRLVIVSVVAMVADHHAISAVHQALRAAGVETCRLCSRCWPRTAIPAHTTCSRTRIRHHAGRRTPGQGDLS